MHPRIPSRPRDDAKCFALRDRSQRPATAAASFTFAVLAAWLIACSPPGSPAPGKLETGRLGRVQLLRPAGTTHGLVFLFSGAQGWGVQEQAASASLRDKGAIVVGVDLPAYRRALDANEGECLYLLSEIEELGRQLERESAVERYFAPILAGVGEGATLAIAAVAQAPAAAIAGAVAVDPTATLRTRLPICAGATAHRADGGFVYTTADPLPGFVSVGFTPSADAAGREHLRSAESAGSGMRIVRDESSQGSGSTPSAMLAELASVYLAANAAQARESRPPHLVELRSALTGAPLVIVLSGDDGWRSLERTLARSLNDRGWNVLGWDSLQYFWREKTPEQLATDLDAAIRQYTTSWNAPSVALVGYEFGADVLPFAFNRLAAESRDLVRQVSLLALSESASFEVRVAGWLRVEAKSEHRVAPELARVPHDRIQCFHVEGGEDSVCPGLEAAGVEVVRSGNGGPLEGNVEGLAGKIIAGLARRGTKLPEPQAPPEAVEGAALPQRLRSSRLRILPVGFLGNSERKTMSRGTLYRARCSLT
jgi:type IV secretory pathway VirJ component